MAAVAGLINIFQFHLIVVYPQIGRFNPSVILIIALFVIRCGFRFLAEHHEHHAGRYDEREQNGSADHVQRAVVGENATQEVFTVGGCRGDETGGVRHNGREHAVRSIDVSVLHLEEVRGVRFQIPNISLVAGITNDCLNQPVPVTFRYIANKREFL